MSETKGPREFWIIINDHGEPSHIAMHAKDERASVHVIEHSVYQELQDELAFIRKQDPVVSAAWEALDEFDPDMYEQLRRAFYKLKSKIYELEKKLGEGR